MGGPNQKKYVGGRKSMNIAHGGGARKRDKKKIHIICNKRRGGERSNLSIAAGLSTKKRGVKTRDTITRRGTHT